MAEYRVREQVQSDPDVPTVDGPGFSLYVDHDGSREQAREVAERIAALLAADDARAAREGHNLRLGQEAAETRGDVEYGAWMRGYRLMRPLADLDALEAAYRKAKVEAQP